MSARWVLSIDKLRSLTYFPYSYLGGNRIIGSYSGRIRLEFLRRTDANIPSHLYYDYKNGILHDVRI